MTGLAFTFEHWALGAIAGVAAAATVAVAAWRRPAVPRATLVLATAGVLLLAAAAGGLAVLRPAARPVAVMVDLSPSTRGAMFRDAAKLAQRVRELLGDTPYEIHNFGERSASHTEMPATDAPAVLLFSDGRLAKTPEALPPVFAAIDPALERVEDAAVTSLATSGDSASVGVRSTASAPRALILRGVDDIQTVAVLPGSFVLSRSITRDAAEVSATFGLGDLWPENDAMRALVPPPAMAQRWWVGDAVPSGAGWKQFTPANLPRNPEGFLGASVVVLDNVSADALDDAQRSALGQYVRDLGGGLLILGGDRAFAAGGYPGTVLDTLSPLASTPPEPTTHWILLADSSGSMNQDADAAAHSRWRFASDAVGSIAKRLPPADLLSIGSFSNEVRWWYRGKPVAGALSLPLPPYDVSVRGKTNLEAALRGIATDADGAVPSHALVATDAQASIDDPAGLAEQLKSRRVTLHVLLIGDAENATGLPALRTIVTGTGGTLRVERLPENWAAGIRELARAALPTHLQRDPVTVWFLEPLASRAEPHIARWNRTWPKSQAVPLAEATAPAAAERVVMAARWNVGEGRVAAGAFAPAADVVDAMARLVERAPRDPRFNIAWETAAKLRVSVDAVDGSTYVNDETVTLELRALDGAMMRHAIPQTAPGRYAIAVESPRSPLIAKVRRGEQVLDTIAVAGRYAPEFGAVGNDRLALAELARRTGGAVIEPGVARRLDIPWPRQRVSLVSFLATAGAALITAGLVRWRVGS